MKSKFVILILSALPVFLGTKPLPPTMVSNETVLFKVRTVSYGGKYSDKNIGAIWVENSQNQFVKTLEVWAKKRMQHLVKWRGVSNENVVDAVTSATLKSHQTHTATWDGTDVNGAVVPDGNYKVYIEFTEENSNKGKPPGKWTVIEFTKSSTAQNLSPNDETYFKDMELSFTPATGGTDPASISGKVIEAATSSPLANATVQLKIGSTVIHEINSDAFGFYSFDNVEPNTYILSGFKQDYSTHSEEVTLGAGEQVTGKDIVLTKQTDATPPAPPKNVKVNGSNL